MAHPTTTTLAEVLVAIQAQIALGTGLPDNRILLVLKKRTPKFQGDQDCLIEPGPPQPEPNLDSSIGRAFPVVYRVLKITLRTRFGVDLSDRSDSWVTDPSFGHYVLEESLLASLNNFQPYDGNYNLILQEPMHWLPSEGPQQDGRDQTWGETTMNFSILYELSMTPTI